MHAIHDPWRRKAATGTALAAWFALVGVGGAAWWAARPSAAIDTDLVPGLILVGSGATVWAATVVAGWCAEHLPIPPLGRSLLAALMATSAVAMLLFGSGAIWLAASVIA